MPVTKSTPVQIGSVTALANAASYTSNLFDVSDAISAEIELVLTYTTNPTTGTIDVKVIASQDGTNVGENAVWFASFSPTASTRYIIGFDVLPHKNIAVVVTNNTDQAVDVVINAIKTT